MKKESGARPFGPHSCSATRKLTAGAMAGLAAVTLAAPAQAAFHLWNIRELYTDTSGTLQYIELFCSASSQLFVGGQQISVTPAGGGTAHTFTLPSNLSLDTANHALLLATSASHAAGAPTPDFVLPANFLFSGGGTISFFGANSGTYTALPTDGVLSRTWGDGNAPNTPQNFAGQIGVVVVPEPATLSVLAIGGLDLWFFIRRRPA